MGSEKQLPFTLEGILDIQRVIADLKRQKEQITQAIDALEGLAPAGNHNHNSSPRAAQNRRKGGHISAEGRKRLSELMRKRWAERRKKAGRAA